MLPSPITFSYAYAAIYTRVVQVGCLRKRWKCAGYEVRSSGAVLLAAVSLDTLASLASAETGAATTRLKLEVGPPTIFTVNGRAAQLRTMSTEFSKA